MNLCSDGTASCAGDPRTWVPGQTQTSNLGLRRAEEAPFFPKSFADRYMEERDEIWFGVTRQF